MSGDNSLVTLPNLGSATSAAPWLSGRYLVKALSEDDISVKFITPALHKAGWDEYTQIRRQVSFTKGRIIVRGKLVREIQTRPSWLEDIGNAVHLTSDVVPWTRESLTVSLRHSGSQGSAAGLSTFEELTRKELQVLKLLARGYSNNVIAKHLLVSDSTVRTHLRGINYKLKVGSRTQAIAIAHEYGLV